MPAADVDAVADPATVADASMGERDAAADALADCERAADADAVGLALAERLALPVKVEYIHAQSGSKAAPALPVTLGLALAESEADALAVAGSVSDARALVDSVDDVDALAVAAEVALDIADAADDALALADAAGDTLARSDATDALALTDAADAVALSSETEAVALADAADDALTLSDAADAHALIEAACEFVAYAVNESLRDALGLALLDADDSGDGCFGVPEELDDALGVKDRAVCNAASNTNARIVQERFRVLKLQQRMHVVGST